MWSKKFHRFQMLTGIERGIQLENFHKYTGYSASVQETRCFIYLYLIVFFQALFKCKISVNNYTFRLELYGYNTMAVDVKSYWRLLIDEVLNPFYLFEVFSCVVWTVDEYIIYAGCIFVVSIVSVAVALYEIRKVLTFLILKSILSCCNLNYFCFTFSKAKRSRK